MSSPTLILGNRSVTLYRTPYCRADSPAVYTHLPPHEAAPLADLLAAHALLLVAVDEPDWEAHFSPWPAPKAFKGSADFSGSADAYRNYLKNNFGRTNSMTWSHVFDNRDNVYDPTKGKRLAFTGVWAGHGMGGDFDYFKFIAENRLYYKVGRAHVIAVRLMGGIATGDMPYNDLFTLGGGALLFWILA